MFGEALDVLISDYAMPGMDGAELLGNDPEQARTTALSFELWLRKTSYVKSTAKAFGFLPHEPATSNIQHPTPNIQRSTGLAISIMLRIRRSAF